MSICGHGKVNNIPKEKWGICWVPWSQGGGCGQHASCFGNKYLNFSSYLKNQAQIIATLSVSTSVNVGPSQAVSLSTYLIAEK